jgi:hypothetical protein
MAPLSDAQVKGANDSEQNSLSCLADARNAGETTL